MAEYFVEPRGSRLFLDVGCPCKRALADVTLTRVADTSTAIPNAVGNFTHFDWLSVDGGTLVFANDRRGIYRFRDGQLEQVADTSTPLSDRSAFVDLRYPAVSGERIVFWGRHADGITNGLYEFIGGDLSVIADTSTSLPGGNSFSDFGPPIVQDGLVVFEAETDLGAGVYLFGGGLRTVADASTLMPGRSEPFQQFFSRLQLDDGSVVFGGKSAEVAGIFADTAGELREIVSEESAGLRTVADFSANDGEVVFRAVLDDDTHGIHETAVRGAGPPVMIADANSFEPALDSSNPFPRSSVALASARGVGVLANTSDGEHGIFWLRDGEWTQIVKSGELLDGMPISRIEAFNGNELGDTQLGFIVNFEGNSQAIYLATIPEPSAFVLALLCCLSVPRRRRTGKAVSFADRFRQDSVGARAPLGRPRPMGTSGSHDSD